MNLLDLAEHGDTRNVQVVSHSPEAKLVLFSLRDGQRAQGRGEPRVHLLALAGAGELWAGHVRVPATAGTILETGIGEPHGAEAGTGDFLVLGIITPAHEHGGSMIAATRVAVVAALAWFAVANLLGLLMGVGVASYAWRPAHAHMNLLGFVAMMIYGVAYHALPRFAGVPFTRPRLALGQVIAANVALAGMALAWGLGWPTAWFAISGGLQVLASYLFIGLLAELLLLKRPFTMRGR